MAWIKSIFHGIIDMSEVVVIPIVIKTFYVFCQFPITVDLGITKGEEMDVFEIGECFLTPQGREIEKEELFGVIGNGEIIEK